MDLFNCSVLSIRCLKVLPARWGTADAEIKGAPVVGPHIALHVVPALQGFYLPSFCLPGSCNFIFIQIAPILNGVECVLSRRESELLLVVEIHLISP